MGSAVAIALGVLPGRGDDVGDDRGVGTTVVATPLVVSCHWPVYAFGSRSNMDGARRFLVAGLWRPAIVFAAAAVGRASGVP